MEVGIELPRMMFRLLSCSVTLTFILSLATDRVQPNYFTLSMPLMKQQKSYNIFLIGMILFQHKIRQHLKFEDFLLYL